jgi:AcrR family transcriptional regulator
MLDTVSAKPRKKPRQKRSKEMVSAILEATARVVRQEGVQAASTNRIAKVAGVSVGSVYQYFPNKQALLLALAQQHSEAQIARLAALMGDAAVAGSPAELVRGYVRATIVVHKEDPELHLALTAAMLTHGLGRALQDHHAARQMVASYLHAQAERLEVRHVDHAAWILVTTVDTLVHTALFEGAERLDDPAFEAEIVRLVLRYVGLPDLG